MFHRPGILPFSAELPCLRRREGLVAGAGDGAAVGVGPVPLPSRRLRLPVRGRARRLEARHRVGGVGLEAERLPGRTRRWATRRGPAPGGDSGGA